MDTNRNHFQGESNGSDNEDSSDSFSVLSEILAVSDLDCDFSSDDEETDNVNSKTNTNSNRYRSVPRLRNNNNNKNLFRSSTSSNSSSSSSNFPSCSSSFQSSRVSRQRLTTLDDEWPDSAHLSSSSIPGTNVEHGRFNKNDHIVSVLRGTFADLLPPGRGGDIISDIQHIFDKQEKTIEVLEKALSEKELQLKKLRASRPVPIQDGKKALSSLLERYPQAMNSYRKRIEHDEYKKELDECTQLFETQKQEIINTHKQNYEILRLNYRKKFKKELDRIYNKSEEEEENI